MPYRIQWATRRQPAIDSTSVTAIRRYRERYWAWADLAGPASGICRMSSVGRVAVPISSIRSCIDTSASPGPGRSSRPAVLQVERYPLRALEVHRTKVPCSSPEPGIGSGVRPARQAFRMLVTMRIAPGPTMTTNSDGSTHRISGKTIFTGICWAFASAR